MCVYMALNALRNRVATIWSSRLTRLTVGDNCLYVAQRKGLSSSPTHRFSRYFVRNNQCTIFRDSELHLITIASDNYGVQAYNDMTGEAFTERELRSSVG